MKPEEASSNSERVYDTHLTTSNSEGESLYLEGSYDWSGG